MPSTKPRPSVLGPQGIHLIHEVGEELAEQERQARRETVEMASVRPAPGTSDLLSRPLSVDCIGGVGSSGKVRTMLVYDLLGMGPIHLKRER